MISWLHNSSVPQVPSADEPTPATLKQFSGGQREIVSFAHPEFEGHQVISENQGDARKWIEEYYDSLRSPEVIVKNRKKKKAPAETLHQKQSSAGGKR